MSRYLLTITLAVEVDDDHALREAAVAIARAFEESVGGDDFSATDAVALDTGSALAFMVHQATQDLPGVAAAAPVEGGDYGIQRLD